MRRHIAKVFRNLHLKHAPVIVICKRLVSLQFQQLQNTCFPPPRQWMVQQQQCRAYLWGMCMGDVTTESDCAYFNNTLYLAFDNLYANCI